MRSQIGPHNYPANHVPSVGKPTKWWHHKCWIPLTIHTKARQNLFCRGLNSTLASRKLLKRTKSVVFFKNKFFLDFFHFKVQIPPLWTNSLKTRKGVLGVGKLTKSWHFSRKKRFEMALSGHLKCFQKTCFLVWEGVAVLFEQLLSRFSSFSSFDRTRNFMRSSKNALRIWKLRKKEWK